MHTNKITPFFLFVLYLGLLAPISSHALSSKVVESAHTKVSLISEHNSVAPNETFIVGIRFEIEPDWHIYWKNPGENGFAPEVTWSIPEGYQIENLEWPAPKRYFSYEMTSFIYENEVIFLSRISPKNNTTSKKSISIGASIDWLTCKEQCLPGSGSVELNLPIRKSNQLDSKNSSIIQKAHKRIPSSSSSWLTQSTQKNDHTVIELSHPQLSLMKPVDIDFFSFETEFVSKPKVTYHADKISLELDSPLEGKISGLLTTTSSWLPVQKQTSLLIGEASSSTTVSFKESIDSTTAPPVSSIQKQSIWHLLPLAFLGGFILNFMPCVFPVISLKILSFVEQSRNSNNSVGKHGIVYSIGILLSLWCLLILILALKYAGNQIGWGFQLQSPWFVFAISTIFLLFTLNLFGLFEMGMSLTGAGQKLSSQSGYKGSFFSGVFTTIVSTPCSGPVLAPILGISLNSSIPQSFILFTCIGIGLLLPYLLLSLFPAWLQRLPKPGAWMLYFKQGMGFLMLASFCYFAWTLLGHFDEDVFLQLMLLIIASCFAVWLFVVSKSKYLKAIATLLLLLALWNTNEAMKPQKISWEKWSPETVETLLSQDKGIYIDFTAKWCATCIANKRVYKEESIIEQFLEKEIVLLKADWTQHDPVITEALKKYGRSAIPFNVYYAPGSKEPISLPELLTEANVLEALVP